MAQKRISKAREGIDRVKLYGVGEAVTLVKDRSTAKFDETVEIAMNLGVDPKHADQMVRGVVNLPNGTGRRLPAPTSSVPRTSSPPCRAAQSSSTAASRPPT